MCAGAGACAIAIIGSVETFTPVVLHEPYEAVRIKECLDDWLSDADERIAASEALLQLHNAHCDSGAGTGDEETANLSRLRRALVKFEVRASIVADLDRQLPPANADGRRTQRIEYGHKAGGEKAGRAYASCAWSLYADEKLRCLALQGLPGDLRAKLTGAYLVDLDGVCSDMRIYMILARQAGVPAGAVTALRRYLGDRQEWHRHVARFHSDAAGWDASEAKLEELIAKLKRWPNALGNGAGYPKLLEMADLPADRN